MVGAAADEARRAGAARLRQPAVGSAVRDGARRQRPRRRRPKSSGDPRARGGRLPRSTAQRPARGRALRELPGRLACSCRADAAARSRRSTPSRDRADDFADEPRSPDAERLRLLDDWERRSHRSTLPDAASADEADPSVRGAAATRSTTHRLPVQLFDDLLSAFRQDVTVQPLCDLGRRARLLPPIGESRSGGSCCASPATTTPVSIAASDALCTALQLTNFWQDLARDWTTGRLYVPLADLAIAPERATPISTRAA